MGTELTGTTHADRKERCNDIRHYSHIFKHKTQTLLVSGDIVFLQFMYGKNLD